MKALARKRRRRIRVETFETTGKPVYDRQADLAARERAAYGETVERRMSHHGVPEYFAKSQECGHGVGRLMKKICKNDEDGQLLAADRIAAAFRFQEIVVEYGKDVLGSPSPNPRAIDMNAVGGLSTREIDEDRVKRLTNDYMRLRGALGMVGEPHRMWRVMMLACVEDADLTNWPAPQVKDLVKGLDAVHAMG